MDTLPTLDDTLSPATDIEHAVFYALVHVEGTLGIPGASLDASREATARWLTRTHLDKPSLCRGAPLAVAVERALSFYETGRELRLSARTEAGAFAAFLTLSRLRGHEALLRWRLGFPWPRDPLQDPLRGELSRLARILPGYRP